MFNPRHSLFSLTSFARRQVVEPITTKVLLLTLRLWLKQGGQESL